MRSTLFLLPLLLAACVAGSAASPSPNPKALESGAAADWPTVRMRGPYTVKLPPSLERFPGRGRDSVVDNYTGPQLRMAFYYFEHSTRGCGVSGRSGARVSTMIVDGRPVAIERYAARADDGRRVERLDAWMHGTDLPQGSPVCVAINTECAAARDCDVAEQIVATVRLGPTTREAAIAAVLAVHPELAVYRTASLPPHTIETERDPSGEWGVAFLRSGSGRHTIFDARCFRVSRFGEVTPAGYFGRTDRDVLDLDPRSCQPR